MKKIILSVVLTLVIIGGTAYADTSDYVNCVDEKVQECEKVAMTKAEFIEGLEAKGITVEEYKTMVMEKYEKLAESKGMTIEEYKAAVTESKSVKMGCCKK